MGAPTPPDAERPWIRRDGVRYRLIGLVSGGGTILTARVLMGDATFSAWEAAGLVVLLVAVMSALIFGGLWLTRHRGP